ncbi:MAG: hypothetical protein ISR48_09025 [Alphaproteobacteria bacterium]|nr:hypothetical protein [Alphaproteobacteria bacterium]
MKKFDDDILMAYVDGELSEEESAAIERSLADDPKAQSKVEEFRKTRTAINKFADILEEPVPDHLIETIRQHEQRPEIIPFPARPWGQNWLLLAASLVLGVSIGTISTIHFSGPDHEREAVTAASRISGLTEALEMAKTDKDAAQEKAATAEIEIARMAEALRVAEAEKEAVLKESLVAEAASQAVTGAGGVGEIFPLKLVDEAIENGSKVSVDMQKNILAELNSETAPVSTASDSSRLSSEPTTDSSLATGAAHVERLEDLQPEIADNLEGAEAPAASPQVSLGRSTIIRNILGEFSFSGQICRLFEYGTQQASPLTALMACKKGEGPWEIVRERSRK